MTRLVFIRHGPTAYNEAGRLQGRVDEPLGDAGRAAVAGWRLPCGLADAHWVTSPLVRACETARLLGAKAAVVEPRLIEMDWGRWESRRLVDLRRELGAAMAVNEARGLDFRPEGGESPREVQTRVIPWLADVGRRGRVTVAVTHKGVMRAVLALAAGWDMTGRPPEKFARAAAHYFTVSGAGLMAVERLNVSLEDGS